MDLDRFLAQVSTYSPADYISGLRSITFGGTGEPQPHPYRGTPNPYETNMQVGWNADGTLQSDIWWYRYSSRWMSVHYEVPLLLSLAYFLMVFGLQYYMKSRKPVEWLNPILTI